MALPARQDWRVRVLLDGTDISDRVVSDIEVTAEEDAAMLATLTVFESGADVVPSDYLYQALIVEHDALDTAGALVTTTRVFEGAVQSSQVDLPRRTLELRATDKLQALVEGLTRAEIDTLTPDAVWHELLSTAQDNNWTYLEQRLESQAASVHRVVGGAVVITPWDTDAAVALTLTDDDIIAGSLGVELGERRDRPDEIRLNVELRYTRRWRRSVNQGWSYPRSLNEYVQDSSDLPSRAMVTQAAEAVPGWLLEDIGFTPVWDDQTVNVEGTDVVFTHNQEVFVIGAVGTFERTWTQTITDTQTLTLAAYDVASPPASPVVLEQTVGISVDADIEDDDAPSVPANTHESTWRYEDDGRADLSTALDVAVRRAERELHAAWRNSAVVLEAPCLPSLSLASRVTVTASDVSGTAKLSQYVHTFSAARATTALRLPVFTGRAAVTSLSRYAGGLDAGAPTPSAVAGFSVPSLTTQLGDSTTTDTFDDALLGFAGNMEATPPDPEYPYRFAFSIPDVPDELRDEQARTVTDTLQVDIPSASLVLWPA